MADAKETVMAAKLFCLYRQWLAEGKPKRKEVGK